jgi:hypothetical protein
MLFLRNHSLTVMPANAGTQLSLSDCELKSGAPAFAGVTDDFTNSKIGYED